MSCTGCETRDALVDDDDPEEEEDAAPEDVDVDEGATRGSWWSSAPPEPEPEPEEEAEEEAPRRRRPKKSKRRSSRSPRAPPPVPERDFDELAKRVAMLESRSDIVPLDDAPEEKSEDGSVDIDHMIEELEDELSSFNSACISALCTPGAPSWAAVGSLLLQSFWAAVISLVLNVLTASVSDQVNQLVEWEDDVVFGWGSTATRHSTYWSWVYAREIAKVPLPTLLTFVVGSMVMCLDMRGTFHESSVNHLIITMGRPLITGSQDSAVAWWRFSVAQVLDKCARIFTISYVAAAIFLIGTSDGTVNLVLNCTALSFLTQVDNMMVEPFALLSRKAYGLAAQDDFVEGIPNGTQLRKMCELIRREPRTQRNFVAATWINFLATWGGMCFGIFYLQRKTSYGDMAMYNENGPLYGLLVPGGVNVISEVLRYILITLMIIYTITDCALVGSVLSHGRPLPTRIAVHGINVILEFLILWVAYTFLHNLVIENMIMKWESMGELADCLAEFGDDCRHRARGYQGQAPN